jgi:hypothetical protein
MLTVWLDTGEKKGAKDDESFARINEIMAEATKTVSAFKVNKLCWRVIWKLTLLTVVHGFSSDCLQSWS